MKTISLKPALEALDLLKKQLVVLDRLLELNSQNDFHQVYEVPVVRDSAVDAESVRDGIGDLFSDKAADGVALAGQARRRARKARSRRVGPRVERGELWDLPVPVVGISGGEAAVRARQSIRQIRREIHQPPNFPDRLPGIVWAPSAKVLQACLDVNLRKQALRAAVEGLKLTSADRRILFEGTELQHVLLLAAYRRVHVIAEPIVQITFGWSGQSRAITPMPRDEVIRELRDRSILDGVSEYARNLFASYDDLYFARVRRLAPFISANLARPDGEALKWRRVQCPTPIVYVGHQRPQSVRALPDYDPAALRDAREDQEIDDQPLFPNTRLNLYRYKQHARLAHHHTPPGPRNRRGTPAAAGEEHAA